MIVIFYISLLLKINDLKLLLSSYNISTSLSSNLEIKFSSNKIIFIINIKNK